MSTSVNAVNVIITPTDILDKATAANPKTKPNLSETVHQMLAAGRSTEIIASSLGISEAQVLEYLGLMTSPTPSLPYGDVPNTKSSGTSLNVLV